jgi:hypothetical protein
VFLDDSTFPSEREKAETDTIHACNEVIRARTAAILLMMILGVASTVASSVMAYLTGQTLMVTGSGLAALSCGLALRALEPRAV